MPQLSIYNVLVMFPLLSDGLVLEEPSFLEQDELLEDTFPDCSSVEGNQLISDKGLNKRPKAVQKNKDEPQSSNKSRKMMHSDTERQRRQEMAALYASFRSLLPIEYIKGKRSASDHMDQAVSYIKHMEKKIGEMKIKRDKLKKLSNSKSVDIDNIAEYPKSCNCVKINPCRGGMEILITSSLSKEGLPLSKVLTELVGRGLNVISCISTRVDKCFLHKIQIEVNDLARINLSELQQGQDNLTKSANGV